MKQQKKVVHVGETKNLYRIWFEGVTLLKMGIKPNQRYNLILNDDGSITGQYNNNNGQRKVSSRKRNGKQLPILDLTNQTIHDHLVKHGCPTHMELTTKSTGFTVNPTQAEKHRKARANKFTLRSLAATAITIGSLFTGLGVFDHAAHAALDDNYIESKPAFQIEISQQYSHYATTNNEYTPNPTNAPIQHITDVLPECDLLIAGVPCNGASISGISKNKLTRPEQHPKVGNLIFYTLQAIIKSQPNHILFENVPSYTNTASADILRATLTDLGYKFTERTVSGSEVGAIENRKRWFMLAYTDQITPVSLHDIQFTKPTTPQTVSDIIQTDISPDQYRPDQPFQAKKQIDKERGNGFSTNNTPITTKDTTIKTIGAGYNKRRPSEPYFHHPKHGYRWFTPVEHARLKGIPEHLIENTPATIAHEMLGQSGNYQIVYQIVEHVYA